MKLFVLLVELPSEIVDFTMPAYVDQMRCLALPDSGGASSICESGQFIDVAEKLIGLDLYLYDGIGLGEGERRRRRERHEPAFLFIVLSPRDRSRGSAIVLHGLKNFSVVVNS